MYNDSTNRLITNYHINSTKNLETSHLEELLWISSQFQLLHNCIHSYSSFDTRHIGCGIRTVCQFGIQVSKDKGVVQMDAQEQDKSRWQGWGIETTDKEEETGGNSRWDKHLDKEEGKTWGILNKEEKNVEIPAYDCMNQKFKSIETTWSKKYSNFEVRRHYSSLQNFIYRHENYNCDKLSSIQLQWVTLMLNVLTCTQFKCR